MFVRITGLFLVAACLVAFASGCKKSSPDQSAEHRADQPASEAAPHMDVIARLHWLGMKQISAESNAASFMTVWNLPETQKLKAQTLDKLALAPWGLPREGTNTTAIVATNATSQLLRPLLDDLLQEESYLEVANVTNQAGAAALAIHLDPQHSALWQTNLAAVLESLTGAHAIPSTNSSGGWQLEIVYQGQATNSQEVSTNYLTFQRKQDWVLLAFGPQHNALLTEFAARVYSHGIPFTPRMTNFWVEAELSLSQIKSAFSLPWALPDAFPKITLTTISQGADLRTLANLQFPKPLELSIEPWNVPTNLIHAPLSSFTAIRSARDLLSSLKLWRDLQIGEPPNQLYFWAQGNAPMLSFCAIPLAETTNRVHQIRNRLLQDGNLWLATNGMGRFGTTTNVDGVAWGHLPFLEPYLQAVGTNQMDFVLAGLGPFPLTNRPAPEALLAQFLSRTNLLYYDWELTGQRVEPWLYIAQFFRFALRKSQVPPESLSVAWLTAIDRLLGNCGTTVAFNGRDELSIVRNSTIGLSAAELQLFVDWLESQRFPCGLNTFTGPVPPQLGVRHKQGTNSPAPSVPDIPK